MNLWYRIDFKIIYYILILLIYKIIKIMKIQIVKEKDFFFVKALWMKWIYAQWETLEEAYSNFIDVYKNIIEIKNNLFLKQSKSMFDFSDLKKMEFVI